MNNIKAFITTLVVALIAIAIYERVPFVKKIVSGQTT